MSEIPGSGDCEARVASLQPILFATSWSYVVVGLALAWWVTSRRDVSRPWGWVLVFGLVMTGLGSVDYHGWAVAPQPAAHDLGIALALLAAWGVDLTRLMGSTRRAAAWVAVVGFAATLASLVWAPMGQWLVGLVGVGLVTTEVLIYRRRLRAITWTQYAAGLSLLVGLALYVISRSGAPLCSPDSWLQGHGVWHLLSALTLGLWALGALPGTASRGTSLTGRTEKGLPSRASARQS